jgi:thiamine biosynthesis lipoprotein
MKHVVALLLLALLASCNSPKQMEATGYAQGTTYKIIYINDGTDLQYQIDSILVDFDRVLSTYQPNSYISQWNANTPPAAQPAWFSEVVGLSQSIAATTQGTFDITVKPLMSFWFEQKWDATAIDTLAIDSILQFVGYNHIADSQGIFVKDNPKVQLDVNGIAQGFSVDVIARYLDGLAIANYLVEIGGEVRAKGQKQDGTPWIVGIDAPNEDENMERKLALSLQLNNQAMATSGNYRKFVVIDGQKLGHTLNPVSGYPATTDLLSATVIAPDAATADAYATAFMGLGVARSKQIIAETELEGILIYSVQGKMETWVSEGLMKQLANRPKQ